MSVHLFINTKRRRAADEGRLRYPLLTQRHENFTLTVARAHIRFAEMAVQLISHLAGLDSQAPQSPVQPAPRLAALPD